MKPEAKTLEFRPYRIDDREWVVDANVKHYRVVEGFSSNFSDVVTKAVNYLESKMTDERSNFIVVEVDGRRGGSVFFSPESKVVGHIRLFYLEEALRSRGLGKQMLHRIIEHARINQFEKVCVATFDRHKAACRLYASLGFQSVIGESNVKFGQRMRQVNFELDLA